VLRPQAQLCYPCPPVNLLGYKSPTASIYVTLRETSSRSSKLDRGEKEEEEVFGDSLAILTCNLSINVCLGEKILSLFTLSIPCYFRNPVNYAVPEEFPLCLTVHHAMKAYWGSGGTATLII